MHDLKIIECSPEQWERYRDIRLEALREEPQAFGSTYTDMEQKPPEYWQGRLAEAALGEESWLLFAQEGERLIGMIGAFYDETQETARIIAVYVSKAKRKMGVGKALMEGILFKIGKKTGIRKIALGVNQEQSAAVRLYQRFGFIIIDEKEELQGDGKKHLGYWMEKKVG
jgi:ribosomal protein S18 acetylase RimI-like enzyme